MGFVQKIDMTNVVFEDTIDAFYRGQFHLVQPKKCGHRSGIDAILLASLVPNDFVGNVADLGAGAGAVGMAVVARVPQAQVTLVEKSDFMIDYARKTQELPQNLIYKNRIKIVQADVCLKGQKRIDCGLLDNSYDFVLFNPPFNTPQDRSSTDQEKVQAHVMSNYMFENWIRTAAAILQSNGRIGLIARPISLQEIVTSMNNRFGDIKIIPIHARPHLAALRVIIQAQAGRKKNITICPPLFLHGAEGHQFLPVTDRLLNGQNSLFEALQIKL